MPRVGAAPAGIRLCPPRGCERFDGSPFRLQGSFGEAQADHLLALAQEAHGRDEGAGVMLEKGTSWRNPAKSIAYTPMSA